MTYLHITRNELLLLGILALLAVLMLLVPWKKLVLQYTEYQASKYDYANVVTEPKKPRPAKPTWDTHAVYSSKDGALELTLKHRHNRPTRDMWIVAEFTSAKSSLPAASAVLRDHSDGVYRSENLNLPKGEWILSITGIQHSEFLFRREQVLKVE